ncbi:U3 small nucleolar RNA-associated protein 6-domain-containing protein [Mycena haematopus]|nr:U3 small nucleolar RNA-associated protein 6-domain-containing protein [Mycena haematopus]
MLSELKDLSKQIMKKRTQFETALVRRVAKKADFLRYAAYEMALEQLRRKRVERLKIVSTQASISDYALKFKADVGLWIQYIDLAKREGAHTLVGRVVARAILMHPDNTALYIIAAAHELEHGSPSAARTLLQRGIRINPTSVDMWREYVRMELVFIENLRRRWDVLGLDQEKGKGREVEDVHAVADSQALLAEDADAGAEARAAIMDGAIVKSVIASAVQAVDRIDLFEALITLIHEFPLADGVQGVLLEQVYGLLRTARPRDPQAARMLAERFLKPELEGEALVDGVQRANEEMAGLCGDEEMIGEYVEFAAAMHKRVMDAALKQYLVSSVRRLIERCGAAGMEDRWRELAG